MNNDVQAAMDIVDRSTLSPEDRAMWKEKLGASPLDLIRTFTDLIRADASLLGLMTDNLRKKLSAGSEQAFAAIFAEEQRMLQAITD